MVGISASTASQMISSYKVPLTPRASETAHPRIRRSRLTFLDRAPRYGGGSRWRMRRIGRGSPRWARNGKRKCRRWRRRSCRRYTCWRRRCCTRRRQRTLYWTGRRRRRNDIFPVMQRYARAADFFDERLAARLKLLQIRRTKWFVSGFGKDHVSHLEIANRTIIRRRKRVDLFRNTQ